MLKKLDDFAMKFSAVVGGLTFVAMILIIVFNVFARLIFLKSFAWAEEIAYLCLNWAVFMGVCLLFRDNALVAIDVLVNALPRKIQHIISILMQALVLALNCGLIVWSLQLGISTLQGGRTTAILKIPFFWYYIAVTVAAVILTGYSIRNLVILLKGGELQETALEDRA